MGLFDKIFPNKTSARHKAGQFAALTAYQPTFTSWNGELFDSDIMRSSIHALATHTAKLKVEFFGRGSEYIGSRLRQPNPLMTWYQFLYRTRVIYEATNTAFIVPVFDRFGRVTALYPVLPFNAEVVDVNDEPWLAFQFAAGEFAQVPVWQVAMLRKMQYKNDFFGEDNRSLRPVLNLVSIQDQGITEAVKSAATYRFMAQYSSAAFSDDIEEAQRKFNAAANAGGLVKLFPHEFENVKQIESKPYVVDAATIKEIKERTYNYFGVNEDILQNKAYGDKWSAFYEGAIEPFAIQCSEVLAMMLVLCGELTGPSANVMLTANRLQYMSSKEKLDVSAQLSDRGVLNRDEVREIWNLPPIPDGTGKAYIIRGEYKNAADQVTEGGSANE